MRRERLMSLTDLKRKSTPKNRQSVDLDDFIDDAMHYAHGRSLLDEKEQERRRLTPLHQKHIVLYKHATFSLTVDTIASLDRMAKVTGLPKSKIIRHLISELDRLPESALISRLHALDQIGH